MVCNIRLSGRTAGVIDGSRARLVAERLFEFAVLPRGIWPESLVSFSLEVNP
jgi:hypothetical protein